jgi:hypothetical protein
MQILPRGTPMSEDFTNKAVSAALAEKLRAARTPEEIRDLCVQDGERRGVFVRDASGSTSVRENPVAPQPAPQAASQSDQLLRRAVTLPSGTTRLLEAYSESGLDILERALRKNQI